MAIKCIGLLFLTFTPLTYSNSIEKFQELQSKRKPLLETYWESYLSFPYDYSKPCINDLNPNPINVNAYGYDIKEIPDGVNIVNIAFASPHVYSCRNGAGCNALICGLHLFYKADNSDFMRLEELKQSIKDLQARGILVKLSYGGEEWGNLDVYEKTSNWIENNARIMVNTINDLGLDGIDLVQEQGYGTENMNADNLSSIQLYFLKYLRDLMPTKLISYTFPGYNRLIDFPFRDVVQYGQKYLNTINVFRGKMETVEELVVEYGVPKSKIILGLSIGCNQNPFETVDLSSAINYTNYVKNEGLAGIMTWSFNRDTDHRTAISDCNDLQTGQADGTFLRTINENLRQK